MIAIRPAVWFSIQCNRDIRASLRHPLKMKVSCGARTLQAQRNSDITQRHRRTRGPDIARSDVAMTPGATFPSS
jgi:hypothetical protein